MRLQPGVDNSPIILLGASIRALAASAARAGIAARGADLFADCDTQALLDVHQARQFPSDLIAYAAKSPHSPWIYTGGLENYPEHIQHLAKSHPLLGNEREVLLQVRDIARIRRWAAAAGLSATRAYAPENADDALALVKSSQSSGGLGVQLYRGQPLAAGQRLECWEAGQAGSAAFLSSPHPTPRCSLLGASWQIAAHSSSAGPVRFQYGGSVGPAKLPAPWPAKLVDFGDLVTRETGIVGLWGVDYIYTPASMTVLEINPRWTASMELFELLTGASLLPLHIEACLGERGAAGGSESTKDGGKNTFPNGGLGARHFIGVDERPQFAGGNFPQLPKWLERKGSLDEHTPSTMFAAKQIVYFPQPIVTPDDWLQRVEGWNDCADQPRIADYGPPGTRYDRHTPICTILHVAAVADAGEVLAATADRERQLLAAMQNSPS